MKLLGGKEISVGREVLVDALDGCHLATQEQVTEALQAAKNLCPAFPGVNEIVQVHLDGGEIHVWTPKIDPKLFAAEGVCSLQTPSVGVTRNILAQVWTKSSQICIDAPSRRQLDKDKFKAFGGIKIFYLNWTSVELGFYITL